MGARRRPLRVFEHWCFGTCFAASASERRGGALAGGLRFARVRCASLDVVGKPRVRTAANYLGCKTHQARRAALGGKVLRGADGTTHRSTLAGHQWYPRQSRRATFSIDATLSQLCGVRERGIGSHADDAITCANGHRTCLRCAGRKSLCERHRRPACESLRRVLRCATPGCRTDACTKRGDHERDCIERSRFLLLRNGFRRLGCPCLILFL